MIAAAPSAPRRLWLRRQAVGDISDSVCLVSLADEALCDEWRAAHGHAELVSTQPKPSQASGQV